ncbi:MAG: hypothetical protein KJ630_05780 [Proteobacteria bacterium]|nr:hypothetical protein [Pseudomonadota bacterium]
MKIITIALPYTKLMAISLASVSIGTAIPPTGARMTVLPGMVEVVRENSGATTEGKQGNPDRILTTSRSNPRQLFALEKIVSSMGYLNISGFYF